MNQLKKTKIDFLYTFCYQNNHIDKAVKRLICSIESIINQNVNVLVYNASKKCILDKLEHLEGVKYLHKHQKKRFTKAININFGVKQMVDKTYFILSDIDLIYHADYVARLLHHIDVKETPVRVVGYNYNLMKEEYTSDVFKLANETQKASGGFAHGNGLINTKSFYTIKGYDEEFIGHGPEDDMFNSRILHINKLVYDRKAISYHLWHEPLGIYQIDKNKLIWYKRKKKLTLKKDNLDLDDIVANKRKKDWGVVK